MVASLEIATDQDRYFPGDSDLARRMRTFDWSGTDLGPAEEWPQSLRTAVAIMLSSRYPMFLAWGERLSFLYNDGYAPILGQKHPVALGQPFARIWSEIWESIRPLVDRALSGAPTWSEDLLLFMERKGYREETYYTFSYSPLRDESTDVSGMFCACTETTQRVIGERQMALLRALAAGTANSRSWRDACERSAEALGSNPRDLPFALIFIAEQEAAGPPALVGMSGCELPASSHLADPAAWPLAEALGSSEIVVVENLPHRLKGSLPSGPWPDPPTRAALIPIAATGQTGHGGVLVVGLNPFRMFDDGYGNFLKLVAGQISAGIASAQAYEEEKRRAESLAEIDRAKTLFFTNISHEFRTPLTLMLGPVEEILSSHGGGGPESRELLQLVHRHGLRLLKLVNSLLDFSRIEAGRMQAVYERTDVARLTRELASMFRAAVEKAGLRLVVDCPTIDAAVYLDREHWEKVVVNLLSNAFKFTFAGEIEVRLQLRAHGARKHVELAVRDTGIGIPARDLPHVFERFHRVEGARSRSHEGSGIGLALVHELVKLHGGSVAVESTEGSGTTFVVSLPTGSAHLPQDRIGGVRTQSSTSLAPALYVDEALGWLREDQHVDPSTPGLLDGSGVALVADVEGEARPRIVLADDNGDMREYVRRLLSSRFEVEAVANGAQALAAVRRRPPDLVLSDVMMPELDGFGLLDQLRSDPELRSIPVIMLSARAGAEARIEGVTAGADDYLVKPFSAAELLARVESHVRMSRLRRESAESLRTSEARFRAFTSATSDVVYRMSADWTQLQHLDGRDFIDSTLEPSTTWLEKYIPPEDRPHVEEAIRRAIETKGVFELEHRVKRVDGSLGWTYSRAVPILGADGAIEEWFGAASDVTRSKEAEQEKRAAEDALREADRRKDEFLATLAHELRNPLAPVRNAVQVLRLKGSEQPEIRWARDVIDRQVEHLTRLIDDLLDVSRITRNVLELRTQKIELVEVINGAVESSRPFIEQCGHELTVTLPARAIHLQGDLVRLAQVFLNLLNNAAKYTERAGRIWLTAEIEGAEVVVRVKDTGLGIPPEKLPRVFDLFFQVDDSLERSQGGLGIGLSLVRRLVELHGGRTEAHSDGPGKGSEFVVRLPVLPEQPVSDGGLASGGEHLPKMPARRILVVDDNRDATDSLAMLLRLSGNEVHTAYDGVDGVAAAERFRPDVVLLDIGMPRMNGEVACRRIREAPWGRDMVLIALTGWGQDADRRRTREAGFDAHLVKPLDPEALRTVLAAPISET